MSQIKDTLCKHNVHMFYHSWNITVKLPIQQLQCHTTLVLSQAREGVMSLRLSYKGQRLENVAEN